MRHSRLLSIATATPAHRQSQEDTVQWVQKWLTDQPPALRHKAQRIFRQAGVDTRYTVLPLEATFSSRSLTDTMAIYRTALIDLGTQVLAKALTQATIEARQVDCLISVSCTGYLAPSLGAHLVDRCGLRPDTFRQPVTEMGCGGGAAALLYAHQYLTANPGHTVAVVCVELCSLTFQREDLSWANIISTALFGDGAACALFGPSERSGLTLVDGRMTQLPDSLDLLGFNLTETGFRMVLDPDIPDRIASAFWPLVRPLLEKNDLTPAQIAHWVLHPGGRQILDRLTPLLTTENQPDPLVHSYGVLRDDGNLSSVTVLFILERLLTRHPLADQDWVWLGAFAPGFTTLQVLLQWEEAA